MFGIYLSIVCSSRKDIWMLFFSIAMFPREILQTVRFHLLLIINLIPVYLSALSTVNQNDPKFSFEAHTTALLIIIIVLITENILKCLVLLSHLERSSVRTEAIVRLNFC